MVGMLSMASRNVTRRILRAANNTLERNSVEAIVNHRQIHTGVRIVCKISNKQIKTPLRGSNWSYGLRHFHASPAVFKIVVVKVPPFADSVSEGDVRWEKKKGDHVAEDEVVVEIETDKTAVPVPAPGNGIIVETLVANGATVRADQELFKIELTGTAPPAGAAKTAAPQAAEPKAAPAVSAPPPPPSPKSPSPLPPPPKPSKAPAAAPMTSIPVAAIRHAQSIEEAIVRVPPADPTTEISGTRTEHRVKLTRMRLRISQRLKEAQNVNAMLTTFNEIDMGNITEWRKQNLESFTKKYGFKFGFMSVFCKASAYALQDQPVVNAVIDGNQIIYRDYVDISVAVATPKGLVVPVLRNVQQMNYADIEREMNVMADKAKKGALAVEDMDGGTFTISNGGVFGSLMGTPIINPPQSAILGMHGIFDRPVAVKGQVVVRPMMYVALTYDHRLIDGREAVMFLRKIKACVEDPRVMLAGM